VALLHVNLTGMLPSQIGVNLMQVETARRGRLRPKTDVDAVSRALEHSVSETLSSELNRMFTNADQGSVRDETLAYREADQILVRNRLSERQIQVLRLLGEGKTNKEIAEALFRSPNTIKLHVSAILKQLQLKSRTQAALLASRLYKEGSTDLSGCDIRSWKATPAARHKIRRSRTDHEV
jgi:DNA-binding NarL/FixJ family response regulator